MTVPGGYGDWQRIDQWIGNPLFTDVSVTYNAITIRGPFYVGTWEAIQIHASQSNAVGWYLEIDFYSDQAQINFIGSVRYRSRGNTSDSVDDSCEILGPWVRFVIGPSVAGLIASINAVPRKGQNIRTRPAGDGRLISISGASVAASSVTDTFTTSVNPGQARLGLVSTATVFRLSVEAALDNGTFTVLQSYQSGASNPSIRYFNDLLMVPPITLRFRFFNDDAAINSYSLSVVLAFS
jgi:hypothetical protein